MSLPVATITCHDADDSALTRLDSAQRTDVHRELESVPGPETYQPYVQITDDSTADSAYVFGRTCVCVKTISCTTQGATSVIIQQLQKTMTP